MIKVLIIILSALMFICRCSESIVYFVRHSTTGQTNHVEVATDATVNDLARAIIGLGDRSGLAMCLGSQSFVTADGITIQYAGHDLEPRDAPLADFGVGQEALIEYKPKEYQIRGVSCNNTAIVYNVFVGETGIFDQMVEQSRRVFGIETESIEFVFSLGNETLPIVPLGEGLPVMGCAEAFLDPRPMTAFYRTNSVGLPLSARLVEWDFIEHEPSLFTYHHLKSFVERGEGLSFTIIVYIPREVTMVIYDQDAQQPRRLV